jgi:cytochrome c oxidase subunit 1
MKKGVLLCLLIAVFWVMMPDQVRAEEAERDRKKETPEHRHGVELFLGNTHNDGENGFSIGLTYEYRLSELFGIGGLTGLFLGAAATDVHLHDTYFIVAHFHFTMMGGTLIAFLGGLHYWWPKITGRMFSELWGRIACMMVFLSFNLTFLPQFVLGTHGMPRRYFSYEAMLDKHPEFYTYNLLSSIGAFCLATGMTMILFYLLHSLWRGRPAPDNPWGAASLEWQCSSPPPHDNFAVTPTVDDPYDFSTNRYDPKTRQFIRVT